MCACACVCVQKQISWALHCWRKASTALSAMMTRFTSSSLREARSRLPTQARPRCPGLPESARSERQLNPLVALVSIIVLVLSLGLKAIYSACKVMERKGWNKGGEKLPIIRSIKWWAYLMRYVSYTEWHVNGFRRTFCILFPSELPLSCQHDIRSKSTSNRASLITVSSLSEVLFVPLLPGKVQVNKLPPPIANPLPHFIVISSSFTPPPFLLLPIFPVSPHFVCCQHSQSRQHA